MTFQAFAIIFAVFVDKQPTRVKVVPKAQPKLKSIDMSAIPADAPALNPPKDTPYTIEELKKFDGTVEGQPIYVAIKGIIFDGEFSLMYWLEYPSSAKLKPWFVKYRANVRLYHQSPRRRKCMDPEQVTP